VRVVFFGTPEFAVPPLEALLGEGFDVASVVTRPDKPQGRSRSTLVPSPVKTAAQEEDLPVLQPERPSTSEFLDAIRRLAPDVGVVVAYGHLLTPELLAIPRRGMVNVHPSLLPELRGAAPVEWAILRGLEQTGVTIMQMTAGLDSGPILHQLPHRIPDDVTGGELAIHLAEMGAQALVEALALMEQDMLRPMPQDETRATYAPKITRDTARIRWDAGPDAVMRTTLALDPKPGAWTTLEGKELQIFDARKHLVRAFGAVKGKIGEIVEVSDRSFQVGAQGGRVEVLRAKLGDGKKVASADLLSAGSIRAGMLLGN